MTNLLPTAERALAGELGVTYHGPLYQPTRYPDIKDPTVAFDGSRWHLFGTGCGLPSGPEVLHSTAPALAGPWSEEPTPILEGVGHIRHAMAPGVVAEGSRLHLFLQHEFNVLGGHIDHLVSDNGGASFVRRATAVRARPQAGEAGVYDPDAAEVAGRRYLIYAGMSVVGQPDLYLARSRSGLWNGPWLRLGCVLDHERVPCHNQIGEADYEWGLEGPHLLELFHPGGASAGVLLTAVCFLPGRPAGHRQRLLMAVAERVTGPYRVVGTAVEPSGPGGQGENGHATTALENGLIQLVYQERAGDGLPWRILRATADPAALTKVLLSAGESDAADEGGDMMRATSMPVAV